MSVAVSLTAPQSDPQAVADAASTVEAFGFDGLFLFDHLVPVGEPTRPVLELAATLGALAASTSGITIGSLVMRAPLRGPAISAGVAATLAAIAPGRVILGLGAGDSQSADEVARFGWDRKRLEGRVSDVRETLAATSDLGVRRWVGGLHPRLVEAALDADGWNAWAIDADRLAPLADRLHARAPDLTVSWGGTVLLGRNRAHLDDLLAARNGRDGTITGTPDEVAAVLQRLIAAAASHLVLSMIPNRRESWEAFAELVLPMVVGRSAVADPVRAKPAGTTSDDR